MVRERMAREQTVWERTVQERTIRERKVGERTDRERTVLVQTGSHFRTFNTAHDDVIKIFIFVYGKQKISHLDGLVTVLGIATQVECNKLEEHHLVRRDYDLPDALETELVRAEPTELQSVYRRIVRCVDDAAAAMLSTLRTQSNRWFN